MNPIDLPALKEEFGPDKVTYTCYHLLINDFNIFSLRQVSPFHCPFEVVALTRVHPTLTQNVEQEVLPVLSHMTPQLAVYLLTVLMVCRLNFSGVAFQVVDLAFISGLHCSPSYP